MHNDPLQPDHHHNNQRPPDDDTTISVINPDGAQLDFSLATLVSFPQSELTYSFSTDHGKHGPYRLSGVALRDIFVGLTFTVAEVLSADAYGTRIYAHEINRSDQPILLCTHKDGHLIGRNEGLIRLIVPSETDNALRQIKWVRHITLID